MIKFKTQLQLKHYIAASFYKLSEGWVVKIFSAILTLLIVWGASFGDFFTMFSGICIFAVILLLIPLIKFLYAKVFNFNYVEYFFGDDSFGYRTGDYKIEVKRQRIKRIRFKSRFILVELPGQKLLFVGEKSDIGSVAEKLASNLKYGKLIPGKSPNVLGKIIFDLVFFACAVAVLCLGLFLRLDRNGYWEVDRCLDAGGAWNDQQCVCGYE